MVFTDRDLSGNNTTADMRFSECEVPRLQHPSHLGAHLTARSSLCLNTRRSDQGGFQQACLPGALSAQGRVQGSLLIPPSSSFQCVQPCDWVENAVACVWQTYGVSSSELAQQSVPTSPPESLGNSSACNPRLMSHWLRTEAGSLRSKEL